MNYLTSLVAGIILYIEVNLDNPREDPTDTHSDRPPMVTAPGAHQHPLGPRLLHKTARDPRRARLLAGVCALAGIALLTTAAWLSPEASGFGTHRQLGLPKCSAIALFGYPCPTCGMTTSFSLTVRGKVFAAFQAQPTGMLFAVGAFLATVACLYTVITGRYWQPNWYRITPTRCVLIFVALIVCGWAYKLVLGLIDGSLPVPTQ